MHLLQRVYQLSCLGAIALTANLSFAQTVTPVELSWDAPKNCPQEPEVQQQLRALLGESGREQTAPFFASGTIEPVAGHYRLTLLIERHATRGTRVIESDDCKSLAQAATVVLGLLVQKERSLGRELSESEISGQPEQPPQPPAARPPPEPAPAPKPAPPQQPAQTPGRFHVLLRAPHGRVDFSTLPHSSYGVGIGVGIEYHRWRALVSGTYFPTARLTSAEPVPHQVQYGRKSIDALGCYGWRLGDIEVSPCVNVEANNVAARAFGDRLISSDRTVSWISVGGGIAGHLHLQRHLALVVMGNGRVTTDRARFLVGTPVGVAEAYGLAESYKVPLVTFDVSIASEWIF